jgi:hypothetical protein
MKESEKQEYERIKSLFSDIDEKQIEMLDGLFVECARLKCELDKMNIIINKTGRIKIHPNNPYIQKELPVSKVIEKTRASYTNITIKLSNILGKSITDEEDNDLEDFE